MIPKLYDKTGTTLLGELANCLVCEVEEERNGTFTLTLTYPVTDSLHEHLVYDNLILARANDEQEGELFRIYNTERIIKGTISVKALHISFDLAYDVITDLTLEARTCEYALNALFANSQFSQHYTGHSDITMESNFVIAQKNILEAIAGTAGSIVDTYGLGAEIKRNNTDIYVYQNRGLDRGVVIEYSVNMTSEALQVDTSQLTTAIFATASYIDPETYETKAITSGRIDSPLINNYSHPFVSYIDYTDKYLTGNMPTVAELEAYAANEYTVNKVDIPKCSYVIDFVPLSRCAGYENIQDEIHLCDIVTIKDSRYGINTQAKVIKYTYNVLTERYITMELGDSRTSLTDFIMGNVIKGEKGDTGEQGEKGEDGNINNFPDTLPDPPVATATSGLGVVQITWTYSNAVYYSYELYASTTEGFTPTVFNLLYSGQGSSYTHTVAPGVTWYYVVRAVNTYGNSTSFSTPVNASASTITSGSDWIGDSAITDDMIGVLDLSRQWVNKLAGSNIDAIGLTAYDLTNKLTFSINSNGQVIMDATSLKISGIEAASKTYVDSAADVAVQNATNAANTLVSNKLTAYYDNVKVDELLATVNNSIQTNTQHIQDINTELDSYNIGGTNLAFNSSPLTLDNWNGINSNLSLIACSNAYNKLAIRASVNTVGQRFGIHQTLMREDFENNQYYTISCWIKCSKTCNASFGLQLMSENATIQLTTSYQYFKFTGLVSTYANSKDIFIEIADEEATSGAFIEIYSLKVERGTFATAWSPNFKDIDSKISNVESVANNNISSINELQNSINDWEATLATISDRINSLENRIYDLEDKL